MGRRDWLAVLCEVRPSKGYPGKVVALVTRIDNRTNDSPDVVLRPLGHGATLCGIALHYWTANEQDPYTRASTGAPSHRIGA